MNELDQRFLEETSRKIGEAKGALRDRDARIASLIRYRQATPAEIMLITGLTKSRIYQIVEAEYGIPASEIDDREDRGNDDR